MIDDSIGFKLVPWQRVGCVERFAKLIIFANCN
jgi:hypothetical protein